MVLFFKTLAVLGIAVLAGCNSTGLAGEGKDKGPDEQPVKSGIYRVSNVAISQNDCEYREDLKNLSGSTKTVLAVDGEITLDVTYPLYLNGDQLTGEHTFVDDMTQFGVDCALSTRVGLTGTLLSREEMDLNEEIVHDGTGSACSTVLNYQCATRYSYHLKWESE